jgi:hypothetical protein
MSRGIKNDMLFSKAGHIVAYCVMFNGSTFPDLIHVDINIAKQYVEAYVKFEVESDIKDNPNKASWAYSKYFYWEDRWDNDTKTQYTVYRTSEKYIDNIDIATIRYVMVHC